MFFIEKQNRFYGICGVYCGLCPSGKGEIMEKANDLKKLIIDDYDWVESAIKKFNYHNFLKGLDWFSNQKCSTCLKIIEPWCEVRKCEEIVNHKLKSCLLCDSFLNCPKTEYQRDRYPYVIGHYHRVKEIGFEKHLEEEEKRSKEGITFLDIRKY